MKCLETRVGRDGTRRRRYAMPNGRRLTTVELPMTVLKGVGWRKVVEHLSAWRRGQEKADRRAKGMKLLSEGWKPAAIAHELGVSEAAVRQWRSTL